jgi:hypothetical protein
VEPRLITAGEVEVGLGSGLGEAVVAPLADAMLIGTELVAEHGLGLALELVRRRQAPAL